METLTPIQDEIVKPILELLAVQKYTGSKLIANTGRNACYRLTRNDQPFFLKISLAKATVLMENDVWYSQTMARLVDDKSPVVAPRIFEHGEGWYLAEYIDAQLLIEKSWQTGDELVTPHIDRLVDVLIWMDESLRPGKVAPLYDSSDSAPYMDLVKKVDGWTEKPLAEGMTSATKIDAAKALIERHRDSILPAFQHGDFVPWHLFVVGARVCLFDGEHASLTKPRYYDLAYLYTRLVTRAAAPQAATKLLARFVERSKVSKADFAEAFLPVVTLRALGMFPDAYNDRAVFDYSQIATELLDKCLEDNLDALL